MREDIIATFAQELKVTWALISMEVSLFGRWGTVHSQRAGRVFVFIDSVSTA